MCVCEINLLFFLLKTGVAQFCDRFVGYKTLLANKLPKYTSVIKTINNSLAFISTVKRV